MDFVGYHPDLVGSAATLCLLLSGSFAPSSFSIISFKMLSELWVLIFYLLNLDGDLGVYYVVSI